MLSDDIRDLCRARRAVILAHNYTRGEVQDVADFTGDSLELARKATAVEADVIVFCGVYFMAETAKILNPSKKVLIPDPSAGCPMADMVSAEDVRREKAKHPGAVAVCYVNSTAEVKAECDLCVTSGNAERVMATIPKGREIIFVPDSHLGDYLSRREGRDYILWPGYCPTHARLSKATVDAARAAHPGAPVLVHPECARDVVEAADAALSTGGMCAWARSSAAKTILVGTETGLLHRLRRENPDKTFIPLSDALVCPNMKKTTLQNLFETLRDTANEVTVDEAVATRARRAIEAMLAIA